MNVRNHGNWGTIDKVQWPHSILDDKLSNELKRPHIIDDNKYYMLTTEGDNIQAQYIKTRELEFACLSCNRIMRSISPLHSDAYGIYDCEYCEQPHYIFLIKIGRGQGYHLIINTKIPPSFLKYCQPDVDFVDPRTQLMNSHVSDMTEPEYDQAFRKIQGEIARDRNADMIPDVIPEENILSVDPNIIDNEKTTPRTAKYWIAEGNINALVFMNTENPVAYQEALACFSKAISINPRNVDAWLGMGEVLLSPPQNRFNEALKCVENALEIAPSSSEARELKERISELHSLHSDIVSTFPGMGYKKPPPLTTRSSQTNPISDHISKPSTKQPELKTINWGDKCPHCGGDIEPYKTVPRGRCKSCDKRVTIKQEPKTIYRWDNCPYCGGNVDQNITSPNHKGPTGKCTVCDRWVKFRDERKTEQQKTSHTAKPKEPEPKTIKWGDRCPHCNGEITPFVENCPLYLDPSGKCKACGQWVTIKNVPGRKDPQASQAGSTTGESCYIVTMCFGIGSPEYMDMVYFRDNTLGRYGVGRAIIYSYYRIGGQLVKYLGYSSTARAVSTHIVRGILVIVRRWNRTGVKT